MLSAGRILMIAGVALVVIGGIVYLLGRAGISFGRLPGDIRIERGNLTCVIALGTSILLSIALTVILNLLARILRK
jgi:hypothetical protein